MSVSRLLPFLSLLMLLPSDAAIVIPSNNQSSLKPSDLCPLVQIVEHELCVHAEVQSRLHDDASNASTLCVLLQEYNVSFCANEKEKNVVTKPINNDVMSIRILEHEFRDDSMEADGEDIHKVCPIINFIEQELCTSRNEELKVEFDPKQLCPLLNLTYTEICE